MTKSGSNRHAWRIARPRAGVVMPRIVAPGRAAHNGGAGNRAVGIFRGDQIEACDMRKLLLSLLIVLPVAAQGQTRIELDEHEFSLARAGR